MTSYVETGPMNVRDYIRESHCCFTTDRVIYDTTRQAVYSQSNEVLVRFSLSMTRKTRHKASHYVSLELIYVTSYGYLTVHPSDAYPAKWINELTIETTTSAQYFKLKISDGDACQLGGHQKAGTAMATTIKPAFPSLEALKTKTNRTTWSSEAL